MLNYLIIHLGFLSSITFLTICACVHCIYICNMFVSRIRWLQGDRDFCIFFPLNLSSMGLCGSDVRASAEHAGSTKRSILACLEIHCIYLNTKVEGAWTHFSSYACGRSESRVPSSMPAIEKVTTTYFC